MNLNYSKNFYQIKSNEEILAKVKIEIENNPYYSLPYQDTLEILDYSKSIWSKNIILIGIGGSSLGVRAIYDFLCTSKKFEKKLFFLETVDPLKISHILKEIDLNSAHFIVISKSGNTIEPISIYKYLDSIITIDKSNLTIITTKQSLLHKLALSKKVKCFFIDERLSGRFSAFSPVGLVPLSIIGVDINELLEGCKLVLESFINQGDFYKPMIEKARFFVENKSRFNINIIFSYSSTLESFNKWYIQLWAESLGKININGTRQALTPIGLIGPEDQHSFLQLISEGVRDKTITFIKIRDFKKELTIPASQSDDVLNMPFLDNLPFSSLINLQADSTIESVLSKQDIPVDVITIESVDESNISKLMFTYQLIVSCIGAFLQINTYDQPGVEESKRILREKLK